MSKHLRLIAALGAVLFAVVGLSACGGGGVPGNAVVQVNGTPITTAAFKHWAAVAAISSAAGGLPSQVPEPPNYTACIAHLKAIAPKPGPTAATLKDQCAKAYKTLVQEVLGFLISSEWVIGEANSLGVKLTDAQVRKQFETIKSQQFPKASEFEKFLASSGQSVSDLLLRVKLNMLSSKIQQQVIKKSAKVTPAQIEKYYEANKSHFGSAEKRNVEIVLTKTEAASTAAKKEIESGKSFASVAKRVSIDTASKAKGGLLSEVVKGQEEAALDAAIFSAKAKVLTGPLKTPFGYYVYEVTSITPGTQQSLAQAQSSIKSQLTATQQQQVLAKFVKEFKAKWTSKTECRAGYVVADCMEYKAPKTTSVATP